MILPARASWTGTPRLRVTGDERSYEASVVSRAGERGGGRFTITYRVGERVRRSCEHPDQGACGAGGTW